MSRSWRYAVRALGYRTIAISSSNFVLFCETFNPTWCCYVFSFTLRLVPEYSDAFTYKAWLQSVSHLSTLLCKMTNLSTFSLYADVGFPFTIHNPILIKLVDALPESCVNLELDTRFPQIIDGDPHLCDHLRARLPRMKHVRICHQPICSALLGTGPLLPAQDSEDFSPISIPKLESLIINCLAVVPDRLPQRCVGAFSAGHIPPTGWDSVTQALEKLIDANGCQPSARVLVINDGESLNEDLDSFHTISRAEMVSRSAVAFPLCTVARRRKNGRDILSCMRNLEEYAEGQIWRDTICRGRLPTALLATPLSGCGSFDVPKPVPIMSVAEFRSRYPREVSTHWLDEEKAGSVVLFSVTRHGHDSYLSQKRRVGRTPMDFISLPNKFYESLI